VRDIPVSGLENKNLGGETFRFLTIRFLGGSEALE
jgi:hypothetical protein